MSCRLFRNPRAGTPGIVVLPAGGFRRARAEITAWPGYAPTPLHDLPALAVAAGVAAVRVKDEAGRFGLGAVAALGGAYAVADALLSAVSRRAGAAAVHTADLRARRLSTDKMTVTCATHGSHGRSVAWGAQTFGAACCIFVPEIVYPTHADAITHFGAELRRIPGTVEDASRAAAQAAEHEGWLLIFDTSWPGYTEVPRLIMQGYRLMPDEALDQWQGPPPTHVFIQAETGAAAASVSVHLRSRLAPTPALIVVEPDRTARLLASAEAGRATSIGAAPSLLAWQELERASTAFVAFDDPAPAIRLLAGQGVMASGSGAAGLAGLLAVAADDAARDAIGLDRDSRVLLFNTEAAPGHTNAAASPAL